MKTKLTPLAKILIALVIVGGLFGAYKFFMSSGSFSGLIPKSSIELPEGVDKNTPIVRVGVVTWGGYAGGQYFNEGFKANAQSRFYKDYKFLVDFIVIDDFITSRDAWKSDDVDLLWVTVDAYPTEVDSLIDYKPKFIFQADWSRGGDAIVARKGINSVNDLKGKKVSVAFGTPSHSFLIWMLKAAGMSLKDIELVEVPSAIDSAKMFKADAVDAAVVWSPDDEDLVTNVPGAIILKNTKSASHIIADGFFVKEKYLKENKKILEQLVEGWLIGASEINSSDTAKKKAAQILAEGLNQPVDFCLKAIDNVRLTTLGDNLNFFDLSSDYQGVNAEDLYVDMSIEYARIGLAPARVSDWSLVSDASLIKSIKLKGPQHAAEGKIDFSAPTDKLANAKSFATKRITVTFPTQSSTLDDNARVTIEREFGSIAKAFANSRVRIEGNTDNTGSRDYNIKLSKKRAEAVANFLVKRFGFSRNRFVIVGNGPDKPVDTNDTPEGRSKNRRTDFELLQ
ncbi:MAG: phosphate ABC transporter substrate-binding/OmpA family protein [Spirochaetia bacterium]|nr:phosphate ABC transporter substrate-binding/OmpA family protein [Spirochaetia bacterium]